MRNEECKEERKYQIERENKYSKSMVIGMNRKDIKEEKVDVSKSYYFSNKEWKDFESAGYIEKKEDEREEKVCKEEVNGNEEVKEKDNKDNEEGSKEDCEWKDERNINDDSVKESSVKEKEKEDECINDEENTNNIGIEDKKEEDVVDDKGEEEKKKKDKAIDKEKEKKEAVDDKEKEEKKEEEMVSNKEEEKEDIINDKKEEQKEMIENIFELGEITVNDIMTHRTEVFAINQEDSCAEVIEKVKDEAFSRVPVYNESIDTITGILYLKDLLGVLDDGAKLCQPIKNLARKAMFVPKSCLADDLLVQFKLKRTQIAVVVRGRLLKAEVVRLPFV